ncbi:hypothetical protein ABFX02_12G067200 [Erythranthe guttata]
MRHANGHYDPHSRPTITRDSYKEFENFRQPLIDELSTLKCKIALTSDVWTPRHNNEHRYVCITAHWIDDNWVLQKRITSFRTCEFPHTGSQLYLHIIGILNDYNIVRKISTICFDNATNNTASVKLLPRHIKPPLDGKLFHVKCACHIFNLCVHDCLKVLSPSISKVRNSV